MHWTELGVVTLLFAAVTGLGFYATRWKRNFPLDRLDEWSLGGRNLGSWVTWFLLSGDIFTAYTYLAAPALMWGAGPSAFYSLTFTAFVYPLVFLPMVRLWSVSRARGYLTTADFVAGRYGSPALALLVAVTGIIAVTFYLALQLAGLEAVLRTMGLNWAGLAGHIPLLVAFGIIAMYTYRAGLRAPALISFAKGLVIYLVIIVAIVTVSWKLGWSTIFTATNAKFTTPSHGEGILLGADEQLRYVTLALGSALALFVYPNVVTGALACRSSKVLKRNLTTLPINALVLGLFALLGYAAIAAHTHPIVNAATGQPDSNTIIPVLFEGQFPPLFAGVAFAAIGIGALVPAAVMSIAAANLWTRNIYKAYLRRDATPEQETTPAKLASLVVKFGAMVLIIMINPEYSINLHQIGGVIILQTLPMVGIALYTRWFHRWGLAAGWALGLAWALSMLYAIPDPITGAKHMGGATLALGTLSLLGWHPFAGSATQIYVGLLALLGNLVVAALVTLVLRPLGVANGIDETQPQDYHGDHHQEASRNSVSKAVVSSGASCCTKCPTLGRTS